MSRLIMAEDHRKFDRGKATEFEEILYASERISPMDVQGLIESFMKFLDQINFNAEEDVICMTGHTVKVAVLLTAASWMDEEDKGIKMLVFDSVSDGYKIRKADFELYTR